MSRPTIPAAEVVHAEKMAAGGDAIAHLADGRVVFVEGALPGETVQVAITTSKRDYARATVTSVEVASPDRVAPPCPAVALGCGGCGWQHAEPSAQLRLKGEIVAEALRRTAKLPDAEVRIGGAVSPWGYRSSMRLAVGAGGRVGLRSARSHDVVPLDACPVAVPALSNALAGVRVSGAEEVSLRASLATGEFTAFADGKRPQIHGLPAGAVTGADARLQEMVAGVSLCVSAASFFQSGPQAAELLVATVREACGDALAAADRVVDAYGGCGLFAATLFPDRAVIVESSPSACADARINVPSGTVVQHLFEQWRLQAAPLVVADPARAGLGREAAAVVAATGADRVVLVSCDPVAMARDTALLIMHGFRHARSTVLDLFPHTPHVEVVTRFDR